MLSTADRSWAPGPPHPRLAERTVHVWRADLEAVGDDVVSLLCRRERERAERLPDERKRRLWTRSRGMLRVLLGRYLGEDPRALRLSVGPQGKPQLSGDGLPFNLSHSAGLALYAFTPSDSVGVDVEVARRTLDEVALAARVFGAAEAERLEGLEPAARERAFLRSWTRHEAVLKCGGTGIGGASSGAPAGAPWIADLELGRRAAGAVAVARAPRALQCWECAPG